MNQGHQLAWAPLQMARCLRVLVHEVLAQPNGDHVAQLGHRPSKHMQSIVGSQQPAKARS